MVLPVALAASAQAEWKILSAESEPGRAGIEHRHVVVEDAAAGQRVAVDVAVFSAKSTALRVIDNPDGQSLGAMMKRENFVCGVNGGYFDTGIQADRLASCRWYNFLAVTPGASDHGNLAAVGPRHRCHSCK